MSLSLPPAVLALVPPRLPDLGPGTPNLPMKAALAAFDPSAFNTDPELAQAAHSALWLYHDFLDESHAISQELHTPTGSLLHGIMHRREPDAGNARYWMRLAGQHPIYPAVAQAAAELGYGKPRDVWDASAFITACDSARGRGNAREELLKRVQLKEWELLLTCCFAPSGRT